MFFKNLKIYKLDGDKLTPGVSLTEQLARGPFERCASNQPMSRGWVSPRNDSELIHAQDGNVLIALRTEERIMPSSAINREVAERAEKMAAEQGYKPGRKQLRELKERVIEELMPRTLTKQHTTFAWIDLNNNTLAIDASTEGKAEAVIEHLRNCLDEFPIKPLHTNVSPQSAMADWLASGEAPPGFTIDRDCELKSVGEEKATVRYVHHPLGDEVHAEIKSHLAAGKLPTKLALTWDDRVSFVLTDGMHIKRLAFLDLIKEEAEKNAEHAEEQFDADFAIMAGELARTIISVINALGGEVEEQHES